MNPGEGNQEKSSPARPDGMHPIRDGAAPAVRLEGVSKTYPGGARALHRADLDIHPGEFIVIVGPSGAGKSTMLRCINLFVRPSEGRLIIGGEEIRGERGGQLRRVRGQVGMIFQQFGLVGRLSVMDNVLAGRLRFHAMPARWGPRLGHASGLGALTILLAMALAVFGPLPGSILLIVSGIATTPILAWICLWCWLVGPSVLRWFPQSDRDAAMDALRAVGIEHLADRRADLLSGGQQQRVAIARTLAQQPSVVLADEPIASLDPVSAIAVMDSLAKINRERGIPVVVNLHHVEVARIYASRIVGMSGGRIVFDGPACDLTEIAVDRIYKGDPTEGRQLAHPRPPSTPQIAHTKRELTPVRPDIANAAI